MDHLKDEEPNYTDLLPAMPSRKDLMQLGVTQLVVDALLPETVAALYEIFHNNPHVNLAEAKWQTTSYGIYVDLKIIGNALGLRVNKKCNHRIPFDCYDYVYRRGKSKTNSINYGPACKGEISISTSTNCKSTKKALYTLRLDPGLRKLLFDDSNSRIRNTADRQRLLNAQRWYRVAGSLDLSSRFFNGLELYARTKDFAQKDGETVFASLMQDTFIAPTNERWIVQKGKKPVLEIEEPKSEEPDECFPDEFSKAFPEPLTKSPSFALEEGTEDNYQKWLEGLTADYNYTLDFDLQNFESPSV